MTELRRGDGDPGIGHVVASIRDIAAERDLGRGDRRSLQTELGQAIDRDELVVWYQPVIDLRTDEFTAVEALVRWNHPRRGLLVPQHFITVAEASGLIATLGTHVLRTACSDARNWREHDCELHLSINAAAAQLSDPAFAPEIERALREFELDPLRLTIEITETAALQVTDTVDALQRIRALGVSLALDDFGTGYSSLAFLRELPVDVVKIDRAFISGLGSNPRDTSILQGVLDTAVTLGRTVVAEGVETVEQAETLRRLGCRYAQGFLWSRPVPGEQILDIVRRGAPSHKVRR